MRITINAPKPVNLISKSSRVGEIPAPTVIAYSLNDKRKSPDERNNPALCRGVFYFVRVIINHPKGEKFMKFTTKNLVTMALLTAMACVVMYFFRIPYMFLTFDLKDAIIVTGGFLFGPLAVIIMSLAVSLVEMFTISETGIFGLIMNVISTCSFACIAVLVYSIKKSFLFAIIGLIIGCLGMTVVMLGFNWLIVPIYTDHAREAVVGMLMPIFLPFNLIKGGINAGVAALLYNPVKLVFKKSGD
jgi:riboflavin transporter FmnP